MIFQTIDDKSECVGLYADGRLHFDNFPTDLSRTWKYTGSIIDNSVQYGWLWSNGKTLEEAAPADLKETLVAAKNKMEAYRRSFEIAKIDMREHCIFDLVPHGFLKEFCEIKNKITEHVFENNTPPLNYEHLSSVYKLLYKISYQKLNLNASDCRHLMHSTIGRRKVGELIKNYNYINYDLYGTKTGRLTTKSNSFPVLTLKKEFRQIMKPNNDLFVSMDYNGAEVRTFLGLCGNAQPEVDIHTWNIENVFKEPGMSREEAKTLFFAWLYNPESEAIENEIYNREKLLDLCYKDGYITTLYGRKMEVDRRRALNYLIQSTTADRVLEKAVMIDRLLKDRKSFISHIIHDEIVLDYSDQDRDLIETIKTVFEDGYVANVKAGNDCLNLKTLEL